MVRRKWAQPPQKKVGRPKINQETESLIVRLAKENLRWGYYRIEGELTKLGFVASLTTVRNVLNRNGIVPTPIQAPNANACSERWVRTVKEECLAHILIINEAHLRRVLKEFIDYDNSHRPHQSLNQQSPIPRVEPATTGKVERRQVLSGIIHDYHRAPDTTAVCLT